VVLRIFVFNVVAVVDDVVVDVVDVVVVDVVVVDADVVGIVDVVDVVVVVVVKPYLQRPFSFAKVLGRHVSMVLPHCCALHYHHHHHLRRPLSFASPI
jgi:hypothetical protein